MITVSYSQISSGVIDDIDIDVGEPTYEEDVYEEVAAQHNQADLEDQTSIDMVSKDDYVLIFEDSILKVGDLNSMEPIIHGLLSGAHDLSRGKKVSVDDIILLKRVKIKFGLFFED